MKNRRLAKNPLLILYLIFSNWISLFLSKFSFSKLNYSAPPRNILISNLAHRGDVLITLSMLKGIKERYPSAKIGFLSGSWNKELLVESCFVDFVHFLDHPKLNREKKNLFSKFIKYISQYKKILKEVRSVGYDISIDVYFYYPSSTLFVKQAKIPRRVGYATSGFKHFLTDSFQFMGSNKHITLHHQLILSVLNIDAKIDFDWAINIKKEKNIKFGKIAEKFELANQFIIFHPFSGDKAKDWTLDSWAKLSYLMKDTGFQVIYTGYGKEQNTRIEKIKEKSPYIINLSNHLAYRELQLVISHSLLVVSVDTFIGHIAALFKVPTVSLHMIPSNTQLWRPCGGIVEVLSKEAHQCYDGYRLKLDEKSSTALGVESVFKTILHHIS